MEIPDMDRSGTQACASLRGSGGTIRGGCAAAAKGSGCTHGGKDRGRDGGCRNGSGTADRGSAGADDDTAWGAGEREYYHIGYRSAYLAVRLLCLYIYKYSNLFKL